MNNCKSVATCTRRQPGIASVFICLMCTLAHEREKAQHQVLLHPHVRAAAVVRGEERIQRLKEEVAEYHRKRGRDTR